MDKFTASNGRIVEITDDGLEFDGVPAASPANTAALREFFAHERDVELGRWRWPENPGYIIAPQQSGAGWVSVLHEPTLTLWAADRTLAENPYAEYIKAARDYFAAHPEPEPWHDAKPGEVWVLRVGDREFPMACVEASDGTERFRLCDRAGTIFALDTPAILSGRRIFPEVSDD